MPELKPCPFCGDKNPGHYEHPSEHDLVRHVVCNTCGASCCDPDTLPEKNAYEAWNTRAAIEAATLKANAELDDLRDTLQFVERWANHHGTKPHITAEQALGCIQHYPPILEITRSYTDGKVPDTRNPWAELEAATEQGKRQPQWLPIADAPVYEDVLIWPRLERTVIAHKNTVGKWEYDEYQAGFGWDNVYLETPPTHWMPLPLPPTATPQGNLS